MGWFKKKPDPISDRARVLSDEIALLESQIQKLDAELQRNGPPRFRASAPVEGGVSEVEAPAGPATANAAAHEPIFEEMRLDRLQSAGENHSTPDHYNELGVRKYDLPALFSRWRNHFRGPSTTNPKLVSYLAAGGIQGLRPLRYEKRVARNRFIALVLVLFAILLGLLAAFVRR